MKDFENRFENLLGLAAGGIGAVGIGIALATNQLWLGVIMFVIFFVGGLLINNAAEIAAAVFAAEGLFFWVLDGTRETMTKGDSFLALIFFLVAIGVMNFRNLP